MHDRRFNPALAASLTLSVLMHVAVLAPLFMLVVTSPGTSQDYLAMKHDVVHSPQEPPQLGLEVPNPSSLTWVGYDEYREHIAALAAFEQAAFTEQPGESSPEVAAVQEPMPIETLAQVDPTLETNEIVEVVEPMQEPDEAEPSAPAMVHVSEPMVDAASPVEVVAAEPVLVPLDRSLGDLPWVRALIEVFDLVPPREEPSESPAEQSHVMDVPASEVVAESTEAIPASSGGLPGDTPKPQSDRESDSFSTVDADPRHWREGQPLAAHGVEIKPQRPHFTLLQRMTASPGNPLVVIRFRGDGVPSSASVTQSSGSVSVDTSIEASLYRWRAAGKALDTLSDGQTFDVTIRIVLNPRAAAEQEAREGD